MQKIDGILNRKYIFKQQNQQVIYKDRLIYFMATATDIN